jgi:hypothetical protein
MTATAPLARQLLALREEDLPALVGERIFSRAGRVLEYGALIGPRAAGSLLSARVRDRTGRSFTTSVSVGEMGVESSCSCGQAQPCEHSAALLLFWTAAPDRFSQPAASPDAVAPMPSYGPGALWRGARGHAGSMAGLLQFQRVGDLRKLAAGAGVDSAGVEKEQLAAQIAPLLAARPSLERALAGLPPAHAIALSLLMLFDAPVSPEELERAMAAVREPPGPSGALAGLKALSVQGLALTSAPTTPGAIGWQAPLEVCQLPPPSALPLAAAAAAAPPDTSSGAATLPALLRALRALMAQRGIEARSPRRRGAFEAQNAMLSVWHNLPEEIAALQRLGQSLFSTSAQLTVAPPDASASDAALAELSQLMACDEGELRLLLRLLQVLNVIEARDGALAFTENAPELFRLSALDQARLLAAAWASDTGWSEVHALDGVSLRRSLSASYYLRPEQLYAELASARRYVVRLVRALAPGAWHGVDSLCEHARVLAPRGYLSQPSPGGTLAWWLALDGGRRPDLAKGGDWSKVGAPFVRAVLRSMATFGIVECDAALTALRVTPLGEYLLGRLPAYQAPPRQPALDVRRDLELRLRVADADPGLLQMLDAAAQLERFERGRFVYRITPARLRDALASGVPLADIAGFLQANGRPPVPRAALDSLDAWAGGFGGTQIYTGLTVLELADELLLPELLRATGLRAALIDQLSPTLLLIDPARADALWAELVAKGYTPRRVRGL